MALQVDRSLTQRQTLGETYELLDGRGKLNAMQRSARLEQKRVESCVSKNPASMMVLSMTVHCLRQDATTAGAAVVNHGLGMARTDREYDLGDLQMAHVSQSP